MYPVSVFARTVPAFRALDSGFERFARDVVGDTSPARVQRDDNGWTLGLDVPGVSREQLGISIDGTVLRIETKADAPRQYKVAYEFSQELDTEASEATLENGVLTLKLTKKAPVITARQLQIK